MGSQNRLGKPHLHGWHAVVKFCSKYKQAACATTAAQLHVTKPHATSNMEYLVQLLWKQRQQIGGSDQVDDATVALVERGGAVDNQHVCNELGDSKG